MPSRRTTTGTNGTTSTVTSQNSVLAFTKAIQGVSKSQESFEKAVEGLNSLISETFSELELKLNAKQKEVNDLEEKYTYDERSKKLEVDLNVKEHGYDAAVKILEERGEVPVASITYDELKRMYEELKTSRDTEVKEAVEREQERNNHHVAVLKETLELKNQAEVAKVQAQLEAQVMQIKVLETTIDRCTKDLDEQRKLTKDVAMASANKQMFMPQQSSGNSRNNN